MFSCAVIILLCVLSSHVVHPQFSSNSFSYQYSVRESFPSVIPSFGNSGNSLPPLSSQSPQLRLDSRNSGNSLPPLSSQSPQLRLDSQATYMYGRDVAIMLFGPYRYSNVYHSKFYVSVNDEFKDTVNAQFTGTQVTVHGSRILFIIPTRVKFMDNIYYYVEIRGRSSGQDWVQATSGSFKVTTFEPHTNPRETREVVLDDANYNQLAGITVADGDLKIELIGLKEFNSPVKLTWQVSVNKEIQTGAATFSGQEFISPGNPWSFIVRGLRLYVYDTVYFLVKAQQMTTGQTRTYPGFHQFPKDIDLEEARRHETSSSTNLTSSVLPKPVALGLSDRPSFETDDFKLNNSTPRQDVLNTATNKDITSTSTTTTSTTEKPCKPSSSTYNNGRRPCAGETLDDSTFVFKNENQIGGIDPEDTFTIYSEDNLANKELRFPSVKPSLLEDKYGQYFVDKNLTLDSCTAINPLYCSQRASGYLILPPVLAGRRTTKDAFSFRYGKLEITAKLPSGDWIVPELWLLPKYRVYGNRSGKIVLAMSRGNKQLFDGVSDFSSRVLEAGVQVNSVNLPLSRLEQSHPWTDDFHTFQLLWTPDELVFSVDDKEVGRVTSGHEGLDPTLRGSKLAPFDQEFYLVYGVHVGGSKDFLDTLINKPWTNFEPKGKLNFWQAKQSWHPSWSDESALRISNIKYTSLHV